MLVLLLGGIIVGIQIPSVQLKIVNKATDYLSNSLKFPIKIEGVHIDWFDQVVLEGVSVEDRQKGKMIFLGESEVDFKILSLLQASVEIEKITLRNGKVNLIKQMDGTLNMNNFIDAISNLSPKAPPGSQIQKSKPFYIPEVALENMYFSFSDVKKPFINDFDHNHFAFDSIYANVSDLTAIADTFKINVKNLSTYETHTYLKIHRLDVDYLITKNKMEFNQLQANIGKSTVRNYLCFNFKNIGEMEDFVEKVNVTSHLENSEVSLNDLSFFAPDLKPYNDLARISGDFKGRVGNFSVKKLSFAFGRNSLVKGILALNGLPELEETFIDFDYKSLKIDTKDLKQYSSLSAYEVLKKFGVISGKGQFIGFANDFVTHGNLSTQLGRLETDINLKIHENKKPKSYYKGHLKTYDFNFGKLIDKSDYIGLLDMDGELEGSGFTLSDANLKLVATIKRIGINRYDYHNIKTNAQLSERLFNGDISILDSNLVFNATGKVDLSDKLSIFNIRAHLEKANLKPLNFSFSNKETVLKTDLYLDYTGLNIDDIEGKASFVNTYLLYNENKEIYIDSLIVQSHKKDNFRVFSIESDLLSAYATGDFQFTHLIEDLQRNLLEYQLNIDNNSVAIKNYYKNRIYIKKPKYSVDFNIIVQDINTILSIYVPHLFISKGVFINGNFTSGYTSILNVNTHIDTLLYNENEIYKSEVQLSTSKIADSVNTLGMLFISSESQKIKSFPLLENFYMEGIWNNES